MRRMSAIMLATIALCGCNLQSCIVDRLVDGGVPSADDVAFDEIMGDPAPLFDGGTTSYGEFTFDTAIDGSKRTLTVSVGDQIVETYVYANGDDSDVTGTGDSNLDGKVDFQYRSVYDGTAIVTTTTLEDKDFDGV